MFKKNILTAISLFLIVAIIGVSTIIYFNSITPTDIFNKNQDCIVEIKAKTDTVGTSYGTGEFIESGKLVTNAHVLYYTKLGQNIFFENISIRFSNEDEYHSVSLLKYDFDLDIAILEYKQKTDYLKIGDSTKLSFGETVYAIGNGSNFGLSITQGIVSMPLVNIEYNDKTRSVIRCDLTITSGNSGGALLDKNGKLVGITTFRTKDNAGNVIYGFCYSIPINIVMDFYNN